MVDSKPWSEYSVSELKEALRNRGMPVSGRKDDLVQRLEKSVFEATIAEEVLSQEKDGSLFERIKMIPLPTMIVISLLVVGSSGGALIYSDEIIDFIQGEPDYVLLEFDYSMTRDYAQTLVDLGHPEWEGRMSGTVEEENTANSIKSNFTSMGIPSTMDEFDVNIFQIGNEPDLSICMPGDIGTIFGGPAPCSTADLNREIIQFVHREDYVIQGYSGSVDIFHSENAEIIDLGNGSDDSDWASAASKIAMVWIEEGTDGNTDLLERALANDVNSMITVNTKVNCDELVMGDCVPYFKGIDLSRFDFIPDSFGFIMVSKSVGDAISENVIGGDGRLQMRLDVDNQAVSTIHVPCGIIEGKSESVIVIGAHHDTVYNGAGAVDDTSGVATLQEMARQFSILQSRLGDPEYTIYFCTWGGEEEGLWGSKEWVDKYRGMLSEGMRLHINMDMNHVDLERNNGLTIYGNSAKDVETLRGISGEFSKEYPELSSKYNVNVNSLASSSMPYNSDHAPFVYEIDDRPDDGMDYGKAVVCYGSGSSEYHTYLDRMDRFNEESLAVSGVILGSLVRYLSYGERA
ncbi:MAG: hypothetical protein CMA62_00330 [Euryarchaeota archaeon]|nr:hypothetical protein [Euryarchaeota archaeon]